jgi:hypothetical protein
MKLSLELRIKRARAMLAAAKRNARRSPRPSLERYIGECRARLERILAELPDPERRRREILAAYAGDAYMTKRVGAIVEIYDARHRPIGALAAAEEELLERELESTGKLPAGAWPGYRGGRTREPGLARWWKPLEDA